MEATDLRPLALGKLLDRAFSLYRKNFWLFVGIMAIPSAFSIPFTVMFFTGQTGAVIGGRPSTLTASTGAILLICAVFSLMAYAMAMGAATYAVSESYLGQQVTVRGSYKKVQGRIWKIVGVVAVTWLRAMGMGIAMGVGVVIISIGGTALLAIVARSSPRPFLGIVVGVLFVLAYLAWIVFWLLWTLRYAVAIPALLLERLGVLASLRRSVQLTKGRRWQTLVAVGICVIVADVGMIIFQGPFLVPMMFTGNGGQPPVWMVFASSICGAIGGAITGSLILIVLVLCYYDTRIRKEAFDLQFMLSALDEPPAAPAPGTVAPA
jgi:hypothetical protein